MTRRTWETTDGWQVACGWDRMLQHFFIDIMRECMACHGEGGIEVESGDSDHGTEQVCETCHGSGQEMLFSNLESKDETLVGEMGGMTIDQVKSVLTKYLTAYPQFIIETLSIDTVRNLGNVDQDYGTIGATNATRNP